MYQEQIESGQKSLAAVQKSEGPSLNDADLALVKKYKSQLEEAEKRYRKQTG